MMQKREFFIANCKALRLPIGCYGEMREYSNYHDERCPGSSMIISLEGKMASILKGRLRVGLAKTNAWEYCKLTCTCEEQKTRFS